MKYLFLKRRTLGLGPSRPQRKNAVPTSLRLEGAYLLSTNQKGHQHFELPVRSDENPKHSINEVDNWLLGFSHPVDDEGDEEDVGECGVDASVEGNSPLLAKPGRVVNTCTVCWPGEKKNAKMQY